MSEILIKKREPTTTVQADSKNNKLERLRQEDCLDLEASLSYTVKTCLKKQKEAGHGGAL